MAEKSGKGKIEEQARKIAEPIITEAGYKLWDVCYEKEGAMWYLRVLFDNDEGIDSDSCEEITRPINQAFDKEDFIKNVDILEVGSPGLSKKLRCAEHFKACLNQKIRATVRDEKGKEISVSGTLLSYDDETGAFEIAEENAPEGTKTELLFSKCVKVNADL